MDPRLESHRTALQLNTRLFRNCLVGVDDDLAHRRPNEQTNNMGFLAMHLVDVRYFLVRFLGGEAESPFKQQLDSIRSIDELQAYPRLADILASWEPTEKLVVDRLGALDAAELDAECEPRFPVADATRRGGVTFLVEHESYHIGQMALLRRFLGLPAMSYA